MPTEQQPPAIAVDCPRRAVRSILVKGRHCDLRLIESAGHDDSIFSLVANSSVKALHAGVTRADHQVQLRDLPLVKPCFAGVHHHSAVALPLRFWGDGQVVAPPAMPIMTDHSGGDQSLGLHTRQYGGGRAAYGALKVGTWGIPRSCQSDLCPELDRTGAPLCADWFDSHRDIMAQRGGCRCPAPRGGELRRGLGRFPARAAPTSARDAAGRSSPSARPRTESGTQRPTVLWRRTVCEPQIRRGVAVG